MSGRTYIIPMKYLWVFFFVAINFTIQVYKDISIFRIDMELMVV